MKLVVRRLTLIGVRERFVASDPGLLRLMAGLRTVTAIALALAVLGLAGADPIHLVVGAIAAMVSTFAISDRTMRGQGITLALGPVAPESSAPPHAVARWIALSPRKHIRFSQQAGNTRSIPSPRQIALWDRSIGYAR